MIRAGGIRPIADELLELMNAHAAAMETAREIQKSIDTLRAMLRDQMAREGFKTVESSGLQIQLKTKKYPQVVDDTALRAHLISLEIEQNYIVSRFDQVKARNDAAKNGWPGVEVEERQEIAVKKLEVSK